MREILFRAWVEDHYENNVPVNKNGKYSKCVSTGFALQYDPSYKEYDVEQYTGLKDKNGKMIFEGDVVKITDHTVEETFESCGALVTMLMTRTYEVFWGVTKWSIRSLKPMLAVDQPIFDLPTSNVTYEIIGNIHDQKEDV